MRVALLFIIPLLLLTGCTGGAPATAVPTLNLDEISPVAETSATVESVSSTGVTASGVLVPSQESRIGSNSISQVDGVFVSLGDKVSEGDLLANLGGRQEAEAALAAAEAAAITAQNDFDTWMEEAPIRAAQLEKDIVVAREALIESQRLLTHLEYQRWLFLTKSEKQIQRIEKEKDTKYSNPTNESLDKAKADLKLKEAELVELKRKFESFADGVDPVELAQRKANLESIQMQAAGARERLNSLDVKAPFDGVVSQVNVQFGDMVNPGQVMFIVTDSSLLRVETTDLSERDIPQVKVGMTVSVRIKPLGISVPGTVKAISARADTIGGDVVYTVVIDLEEVPADARAGMSVEVDF